MWSSISNAARDLIDGVENWVSGFSAIDFVLAAAILWAAYWVWATLRAVTRLGPVEVALLDYDGKDDEKPDVHALTGLMRERLAAGGLLPPPEVPAGSPQTNLIAAVEASGHPQAAWVARALELIPHPPRSPEYKLTGIVLKAATDASAPRLRYWLQPKHTGRSRLATAAETSNEDAVCHAASQIFLEISCDAVHVFPQWAQWTQSEFFRVYVDGIEARFAEQDNDAMAHFETASVGQPANLLPRLQLANLHEKQAGMNGGAGDVWARAKEQGRVLRRYLDIGVARSDLVAARYRAGVVAGMLATTCEVAPGEELTPEKEQALDEIRDIVDLTRDDGSAFPPAEVAGAPRSRGQGGQGCLPACGPLPGTVRQAPAAPSLRAHGDRAAAAAPHNRHLATHAEDPPARQRVVPEGAARGTAAEGSGAMDPPRALPRERRLERPLQRGLLLRAPVQPRAQHPRRAGGAATGGGRCMRS
jgi:hypothetical protein